MTNTYFWEGTKIVKSLDNDFNWRIAGDPKFATALREYTRQAHAGTLGGQVTRQLKARAETTKGKPFYITPAEKPLQKTSVAFKSNKHKGKTT